MQITALDESVIQDKRFFGSAPKENLAAIPDKKERFRGAHGICWMIEAIAVLLLAGAASAENHCFR